MSSDPYSGFREVTSGDNMMAVLRGLADELQNADNEIAILEAKLQEAKNLKNDIAERRIPQATDGMEGTINLGDGRQLIVKEEIRSSIAGDKREPAISWLDDHGYGAIVKRQIIFEFPKGDEERAKKFVEKVMSLDLGTLVMKENNTVHHATLNSWVKERLGEGDEIPFDIFGIFRQRTAKLKEI